MASLSSPLFTWTLPSMLSRTGRLGWNLPSASLLIRYAMVYILRALTNSPLFSCLIPIITMLAEFFREDWAWWQSFSLLTVPDTRAWPSG